jgi:drug/metabolite transporter (DMT)-like permease
LWAGNAVVGSHGHELVPPITLNLLRWVLAFALLLPWAWPLLRPGSGLWPHWRRYALLGLLGVGCLQRAAVPGAEDLHTHQRDAGGVQHAGLHAGHRLRLFFGARGHRGGRLLGAALSMAGVLLVLCAWRDGRCCCNCAWSPGDVYMLVATVVLGLLQLAAGTQTARTRLKSAVTGRPF